MSAEELATWAIAIGRVVLTQAINWFDKVMTATGLEPLWAGALIIIALFSIILVPLRGGADLTRGALGSFVFSRVNKARKIDHDD